MKKIALFLVIFSCLFNQEATASKGEKKTFVQKLLGTKAGQAAGEKIGMMAIEKAGLLHCPKGEKCYCARPTKKANYRSLCKYYDKNQMMHEVRDYSETSQCTILCLGIRIEKAKDNIDVRGTEEKPAVAEPQPQTQASNVNCEKLPNLRGDIVNCCGSTGTANGKRVCFSDRPPQF